MLNINKSNIFEQSNVIVPAFPPSYVPLWLEVLLAESFGASWSLFPSLKIEVWLNKRLIPLCLKSLCFSSSVHYSKVTIWCGPPHLLRWAPAGGARHTQRAPFDLNDPSKNRWKRCVQVNRSSPCWSLWLQRKTERQREKAQECALKQLCMPAQGHITCDEAGSPPAYAWCQLTPLPWKQ